MIYVDSCVPIYAALDSSSKGKWARNLLKKIEDGDEPAITSALTLDEFIYKVRREDGVETSIEAGRALLMTPNLRFIPVDDEVLWKSLELIEAHGLYPRDSIHAGSAILRGVFTIISEDDDFDIIPEMKRRWMD